MVLLSGAGTTRYSIKLFYVSIFFFNIILYEEKRRTRNKSGCVFNDKLTLFGNYINYVFSNIFATGNNSSGIENS
ncbi:hypothetical protein SDC9_43378 [bioreactor metagenome]|uniref:Uncharacterized protein n=1 Tax=bioreactor metagenome TaxID=1076179 RepID=A0A644W193_9ZZZZ